MFKLLYKLPKSYWVAVSGGVDSMAALHFLDKPSRRECLRGVIHINHGTGEYADRAQAFVEAHCREHDINLKVFRVEGRPPKGESKENWWRIQRYKFFKELTEGSDDYIILGHNIDDCLEEYIFCTIVRGYASTIPYAKDNCVRPFRLWKRDNIAEYSERHGVDFVEDPTNTDTRFKRNFIRHKIVPQLKELNPGIYRIIERVINDVDRSTSVAHEMKYGHKQMGSEGCVQCILETKHKKERP